MKSWINYFAKQGTLIDLVTILVIGFGLISLFAVRKEVFPNVDYDLITIVTPFPGATTEEIERLITTPLERELKEVDGVRQMSSVSREGSSTIILQLFVGDRPRNEVQTDIQGVVDRFRQWPDGSEKATVTSIETSLLPIIEVSVYGDLTEMELRKRARLLEERLREIPEVGKIEISGLRDLEISVRADPVKLQRYQVSLQDVIEALRRQNISVPAGSLIEDRGSTRFDLPFRTLGEFSDIESINATVIRANEIGSPITVGQLAKVELGLEKPVSLWKFNGQPSLKLTVMKRTKADAIQLVKEVKQVVQDNQKLLMPAKVGLSNDFSLFVERRMGVLTNNLALGLLLVMFFLSILLPWKVALITAIGIPFAFLAVFICLFLAGFGLNLISMMGLIVVIGMLVDDAVVITENIVRYIEKGLNPLNAAIIGTQEIYPAVLASVLTTILAFMPLAFMDGVMGKFVSELPLVVILALLFSLFECFFILPSHMGRWIEISNTKEKELPKAFNSKASRIWERIVSLYIIYLKSLARRKWIYSLCAITFLGGSIFWAKNYMNFVLFPADGIEIFIARIEGPVGTNINQTREWLIPVEAAISELPEKELDNFVSMIGMIQKSGDITPSPSPHMGQVMVFLHPESQRQRKAHEIMEDLRKKIQINDKVGLSFDRIQSGPPVGPPINVGIRGRNLDEILLAASEVHSFINEVSGVSDVSKSFNRGFTEIIVKVDPIEASAAHLDVGTIGKALRAAVDGFRATSIRQLDEEIFIRVGIEHNDFKSYDDLGNLHVLNIRNQLVPLNRVAKFQRSSGIEQIEHFEGLRQVRIVGQIDTSIITATELSALVTNYWEKQIEEKFPNLILAHQGEAEDTKENMSNLLTAFFIAIILIYFLLILLFQSFFQPFFILATIPFGLSGVVWIFWVHGIPISFLAMVGIVALTGVVINNAIVFIDFFNKSRGSGKRFESALEEAGRLRIRPIFLTTVTTVSGLVPVAYGLGGEDPFIVPVALALGWGLMIGAILTLLVLPILLHCTYGWKNS